jgi:hypothetical protein
LIYTLEAPNLLPWGLVKVFVLTTVAPYVLAMNLARLVVVNDRSDKLKQKIYVSWYRKLESCI